MLNLPGQVLLSTAFDLENDLDLDNDLDCMGARFMEESMLLNLIWPFDLDL